MDKSIKIMLRRLKKIPKTPNKKRLMDTPKKWIIRTIPIISLYRRYRRTSALLVLLPAQATPGSEAPELKGLQYSPPLPAPV